MKRIVTTSFHTTHSCWATSERVNSLQFCFKYGLNENELVSLSLVCVILPEQGDMFRLRVLQNFRFVTNKNLFLLFLLQPKTIKNYFIVLLQPKTKNVLLFLLQPITIKICYFYIKTENNKKLFYCFYYNQKQKIVSSVFITTKTIQICFYCCFIYYNQKQKNCL